jgi:hypothetical protein
MTIAVIAVGSIAFAIAYFWLELKRASAMLDVRLLRWTPSVGQESR